MRRLYRPFRYTNPSKVTITGLCRGVGILISRKVNYTVIKTYTDDAENILGLLINIDDYPLRIFSIYGPNHDNKDFYNRIDAFLSQDPQVAAVIGGDWNTTYSTAPAADNIDIRNMRNPPSSTRSSWLREVCSRHHCSDPFRALHPNLQSVKLSYPCRGLTTSCWRRCWMRTYST